jgi:hypothetical protein
MRRRLSPLCVLVAALVLLVASKPANALNDTQKKCQATIGKTAGKFIKAYLKERSKYSDKQLKDGSGDLTQRNEKIAKAVSKAKAALDKKCGSAVFGGGSNVPNSLKTIGFPGKCGDPDSTNGFTITDLQNCIIDTHESQSGEVGVVVDTKLFDLEFGSNGIDGASPLPSTPPDLGKCQKEIFKNGQKFVATIQKEISKCRDGLIKGTLTGFLPSACGNNTIYTKPAEKIAKARSKLIDKISTKCSDAQIAALDICDTGSGPVTTAVDAANCIADTHRNATDDPDNSGLATPFGGDFIDIEYATAAACGDGILNDPLAAVIGSEKRGPYPEECDGSDDAACPGLCGSATGNFACLCTDIPRQRVVEHENADLDNGWTGLSHDAGIVEGGGYVVDLYDCDGKTSMGALDALCTVGPSCNNMPHQACSNDSVCGGVGNFCRKRATAVGQHCNEDIQTFCTSDGDCNNSAQDFCRKTPHGPPLPLSSNGTAVCVENVFYEDVTGTTNLDTGASAVRLHQKSITRLASGTENQPCPSCGGFCGASLSPQSQGPGGRTLCASDADCPASVKCVTDAICSFGLNQDQPCRRTPPFGAPTEFFGTPSVDCLPNSLFLGAIDILFNPATTGTVTVTPSVLCDAAGYGGSPGTADDKACIAGTNTGQACSADSQCISGGAGSCAFQCFCPTGGGLQEQPNPCLAACRGGGNDMLPCSVDSECPGGFCQQASCRYNPADTDSVQEGICVAGPTFGTCSVTTIKSCSSDANCKRPVCGFCKADNTETCILNNRNCFVNEGIVRTGTVGTPDRVVVSQFCITQTGASAVNSTAGLPGPGALTQPATTETTGLID